MLKFISIFMVVCSMIYTSSVAIMDHNALVKTDARLQKTIKENSDLKQRLASSAAEIESLRKQQVKPAAEKDKAKTTMRQLVCGKPGSIANRLNNPFNIKRQVSGKKWKGEICYDSQGHVHFISVDHGSRAAAFVLKSYYKKHDIATLEAIINRFCGGNKDYVKFLSTRLNLKPNQKFNVLSRLPELMQAMSKYESGRQLPSECLVTLDIVREL